MIKEEKLKKEYTKVLLDLENQWKNESTKAYDYHNDEEYIKLQIKSGIAKMCRALFIKTYNDIFEEK